MKKEFATLQQYLEYLQSRGRYSFLRKEAIAVLHATDNAFKKAMHRLIQKGKVTRIRDDFYTLVPLEYQSSGSLPASWFIDSLMRHIEQPYYCGLLTAAALLGIAHQQPMVFQVVTSKQIRPIQVGSLQIEFLYKKIIQPHFYNPIKTATGSMNVATPEVTAFDLVRYMRASGHISHVATVLCKLAAQLRPEKLAQLVAQNDVDVTSAQRLGYLLENLKLPLNLEPLAQALKLKKPIQRLLITGVEQPILERNQRWQILVNEPVDPDGL